ncbi:MAG: hypothetical protein M3020_24900 [Myxococcota bacterium]|nr:hypothetical protein [Myxococcota bacterium]
MRSGVLGVFGLVFLALGCKESVESTDIRTTGIYPEITVEAEGNGSSTVTVKLKVGGSNSNTFLDLTGGDTLEATVEGETKTLRETSDEVYSASFPVDAEGTEFLIAFLRTEEDESAPASVVELPAPFELEVAPREASRATDDVQLSWDPPGSGDLDWDMSGECIRRQFDELPDDGTHVITADSIETSELDKDDSCTVTVQLERSQRGGIDEAFTEGGRIVAIQRRRGSFTSTP